VVYRLRLRPAAFTALPRGLSLPRRLWLAASMPQRHERDTYLWLRAHQAAVPSCALGVLPQRASGGVGELMAGLRARVVKGLLVAQRLSTPAVVPGVRVVIVAR
jgi:hypothetical protein